MGKGDFTKAKQITLATKQKVWERQKGVSILSHYPITKEMCCCHFIGRGEKSGVGYEWNIVGLTPDEHRLLDENKPIGRYTNQEAQTLLRNHLILNYKGWSEDKCSYHKYWEEKDYGVTRRNESIR